MENNKLDCKYCVYKSYWDMTKSKIQCSSCNDFSNFKELNSIPTPKENKYYKPTVQLSLSEHNFQDEFKGGVKSEKAYL